MSDHHNTEYRAKTRCLRPIENISFTVHEMVSGILTSISPTSVISINQLHGDRKGVVRLTFKTMEAAKELDSKVAARRMQINGVRLAAVSESGHFVRLTLLDVPQYLCSEDLERELGVYGNVVNVRREYMEYQGYRLENETRHVLLSKLVREVPRKMTLEGHDVFISVRPMQAQKDNAAKSGSAADANDADSFPSKSDNAPKHVMNSVYSYFVDGSRRAQATESADSGSASDREHVDGNELDYLQPPSTTKSKRLAPASSTLPRTPSPLVGRKGYHLSAVFKGSESDVEERVGKSDGREAVRARDRCRYGLDHRQAAGDGRGGHSHHDDDGYGCSTRDVPRRRSFDCEGETTRKAQVQIDAYHHRSKTPDRDLRV